MFFLMPLVHDESMESQNDMARLIDEYKMHNTPFASAAKAHYDIIQRFGRYPHRNKILGRNSTEEELEFVRTNDGF